MCSKTSLSAIVLTLSVYFLPVSHAVTVGQTDDFEDGTTANWGVAFFGAPNQNPPTNSASGGPDGINDNYLQLTSTGAMGPGSKLTTFNGVQWSGDYLSASVGGIEMDARNLGANDVNLFLLLAVFDLAGVATDVAVTSGVALSGNGDWQKISFSLLPGDLFAGVGSVVNALMNAQVIRLYHSPDGVFIPQSNQPPPILATIGVDNITATPVPLPPAVWLLLSGAVALSRIRRSV